LGVRLAFSSFLLIHEPHSPGGPEPEVVGGVSHAAARARRDGHAEDAAARAAVASVAPGSFDGKLAQAQKDTQHISSQVYICM